MNIKKAPFCKGRLITTRQYAKGVRTNRPYSFCCRAGVHLPPLSSPFSLVFGGSKPPPYDIMGRKNLLLLISLFTPQADRQAFAPCFAKIAL